MGAGFPDSGGTGLSLIRSFYQQRVAGVQLTEDLDTFVSGNTLTNVHPFCLIVLYPDDKFLFLGGSDGGWGMMREVPVRSNLSFAKAKAPDLSA